MEPGRDGRRKDIENLRTTKNWTKRTVREANSVGEDFWAIKKAEEDA